LRSRGFSRGPQVVSFWKEYIPAALFRIPLAERLISLGDYGGYGEFCPKALDRAELSYSCVSLRERFSHFRRFEFGWPITAFTAIRFLRWNVALHWNLKMPPRGTASAAPERRILRISTRLELSPIFRMRSRAFLCPPVIGWTSRTHTRRLEAFRSRGKLSVARGAAHPGSALVAWSYGNFLLRQGDEASGFAEINHDLRADPKLVPLAVSRVWHLSQDPNVLLNQVLPADQDAYLQAIDFMQANGQPAAALLIWQRLLSLGKPIDVRRLFPLLELLIHSDHAEDASRVWRDALAAAGLPHNEPANQSVIWNGDFARDFLNGGLDWRWSFPFGASIGFDTPPSSGGRTASVQRLLYCFLPVCAGLPGPGRSREARLVPHSLGIFSQPAGNHPIFYVSRHDLLGSASFTKRRCVRTLRESQPLFRICRTCCARRISAARVPRCAQGSFPDGRTAHDHPCRSVDSCGLPRWDRFFRILKWLCWRCSHALAKGCGAPLRLRLHSWSLLRSR
jgi:hypothetical protein